MGFPLEQPSLQRGLIRLLFVPVSIGLREHRQRAERNIVRLKLAVRIAQDAGDFAAEFERAPGIRAEVNAAEVVVVGMEVVPQERLAPENSLQLANRFRRDGLRDYFRSGPENPDGRVQELSQLFQVIGMPDRTRHPLAVVGRTKEQSRVGGLVAKMLQEIIGYDALRIRERVEHPGV